MSKARLVIAAVEIEHRPISQVARDYRVARSWIYTLLARYRAEGEAGLVPRSRRPHTNPRRHDQAVEERIVELRKQLTEQGLDAGPVTIACHLEQELQQHPRTAPAVSTIHKILSRRGFITPAPRKRPRSSYIRFQAEQPNELWQTDITHWRLADDTPHGTSVESSTSSMTTPASPSPAPPDRSSPRWRCATVSAPRSPATGYPPPCSATTAWSSPPATPPDPADAPHSKPNWPPSAWCSRIPGPTTRPPAARWSASTKP
jgi:transposase